MSPALADVQFPSGVLYCRRSPSLFQLSLSLQSLPDYIQIKDGGEHRENSAANADRIGEVQSHSER